MMNLRKTIGLVLASSAVALAGPGGCGKKEAAPQQRSGGSGVGMRAPAKPRVALNDLRLHPKVQFPEDRLPDDLEQAQAIADLASALATGDASALRALVSPADGAVVAMLVDNGQWQRQADATQVVRVCVIGHPPESPVQVGLGVQDSLGAFLMGWEFAEGDSAAKFASLAIEPRFAQTATELDNAELKLLALPASKPVEVASLRPPEQKKVAEDKKEGPSSNPDVPGGLKPDKF